MKVKMATMTYLNSLCSCMDPSDMTNTQDTRMALSRSAQSPVMCHPPLCVIPLCVLTRYVSSSIMCRPPLRVIPPCVSFPVCVVPPCVSSPLACHPIFDNVMGVNPSRSALKYSPKETSFMQLSPIGANFPAQQLEGARAPFSPRACTPVELAPGCGFQFKSPLFKKMF